MAVWSHVEWKVPYEPGELLAKGYRDGREIITAKVETTGNPHAIRLLPDRTELSADRCDVSMVTVEVVDDHGRVVSYADNEIAFASYGDARIIGVGNGDPSSHEPDKASMRRVFNGLCQVIVQAGETPGNVELRAVSPGLLSASAAMRMRETAHGPRL